MANARQLRGDRNRDKWIGLLRSSVVSASLPLAHISSQLSDPSTVLNIIGKGRRASTIRRRVLDWGHLQRFLRLSCGIQWPTCPAQILDDLASIVDGGAGKSVVDRAVFALAFIDSAGGVLDSAMLGKHSLIKSAMEELAVRAARGITHATRKAPQVPNFHVDCIGASYSGRFGTPFCEDVRLVLPGASVWGRFGLMTTVV